MVNIGKYTSPMDPMGNNVKKSISNGSHLTVDVF